MRSQQYIIRNDFSQGKYLEQAYQAMIKQSSIHYLKQKIILISDQFFSIEQNVKAGLDVQQKRHQVEDLLFFIKYKFQYNKKMTLFKESIQQSLDLSYNGEEIYQIRNDSALCEQIKINQYCLRRKNKVIRKFKFPPLYICKSLGQQRNKTVIELAHKQDQGQNYVYYFLESGRCSDFQLPNKMNISQRRMLISKDGKYILIGNTLRLTKNNQIISQFCSDYAQFSDCSRYYVQSDGFNLVMFDLQTQETCCLIQIPNLEITLTKNLLWRMFVDFKNKCIIVEDYKHKMLIFYYFTFYYYTDESIIQPNKIDLGVDKQ